MGTETGLQPCIDLVLESIRNIIVPAFTKFWSSHEHVNPGTNRHNNEVCNLTLTVDGNWKLGRLKCIFADHSTNISTPEFGLIQTGCRNMPLPKSYYCREHSSFEIKFRFKNKLQSINPLFIKASRLSK